MLFVPPSLLLPAVIPPDYLSPTCPACPCAVAHTLSTLHIAASCMLPSPCIAVAGAQSSPYVVVPPYASVLCPPMHRHHLPLSGLTIASTCCCPVATLPVVFSCPPGCCSPVIGGLVGWCPVWLLIVSSFFLYGCCWTGLFFLHVCQVVDCRLFVL